MFTRGSFRYPYIVRLMGTGDMLSLASVASSRWRSDGIVYYSSIPNSYSISNDWLLIDSYEPPGQFSIDSHGGVVQYQNSYFNWNALLIYVQILVIIIFISFTILFTDKIGIPAAYRLVYIKGGMMKVKLVGSGSMELLILSEIGSYLVMYDVEIIFLILFFLCVGLFFLYGVFSLSFLVFILFFGFYLNFGLIFFFLNLGYDGNLNLNSGLFL